MSKTIFHALVCGVCVLAGAAPVRAADETKTIDAPDGAFGFADDSGVTAPGHYQATLDFLPSWSGGTAAGRDLGARAEINTGVLDTLQLGIAAAGLNTRNTPAGEDANTSRNFAVSLPGKWQLRSREVNNVGAAFLFEPFIGRQYNSPAPGGTIYGIDMKFAFDANYDNRFYATFNIGYAVAALSAPAGASESTGLFYFSLAGSYRVTDALYVGAQVRQGWQFAKVNPDQLNGQALSVGPTLAYQVNDNLTFSAVYLRQVAGNDRGRPSSALELTDFRQNDARVRMTVSF